MAIEFRSRRKWKLVAMYTLFGVAFGAGYTLLRIAAGIMSFSWMEIENATRTGGFVALVLATFLIFYIYDPRGAVIRRMSFLTGWIMIDMISTLIIAAAILFQRGIFALLHSEVTLFTRYVSEEFYIDVLISFVVFVVVALFMQVRPLLGEGTMWNVLTGRYHRPRQEHRIYMFLDIKNSTAMANRLGDRQTHALISEVFFDADRWVAEYGGEVLSYNGDELVATWLEAGGQNQARCLECYAQIKKSLANKSDHFQEKYRVRPEFWAGFHVGPVVVGECGDSKRAIVHIGDTPNTAARLEQHAKEIGRDCLVSGALMAELTLPTNLKAEALGSLTLKGHNHDTEIFALEPS